jgi:organic radical activating enzyme
MKNPLTPKQVLDAIQRISVSSPKKIVSLTGGEPLLQDTFLFELLPLLKKQGYTTFLETNGMLPNALSACLEHIDIVAMDIKLDQVIKPHQAKDIKEFMKIAKEKELFIKIVFDMTTIREVNVAVKMISNIDTTTPVFLQPVTGSVIPSVDLIDVVQQSLELLDDVRVIPQLHKVLLVS